MEKNNYTTWHNLPVSKKTKLMIIENFIDYFTSDDLEREAIKEAAWDYVQEDHCNEILDSFVLNEDEFGLHTSCQNCGATTNI